MYKKPSRRGLKKSNAPKPDLIPIMDGVFTLIFFLLMAATFLKVFEVPSDVPIISDNEPPDSKEKPLALTVHVTDNEIQIFTGLPSTIYKTLKKINTSDYDLIAFHDSLLEIKKKFPKETTAILEPDSSLNYEQIIKIMDEIRLLKKTDPEFFIKDKQGQEVRQKLLFGNILFGNIQS